jgi:hypothetical protein
LLSPHVSRSFVRYSGSKSSTCMTS